MAKKKNNSKKHKFKYAEPVGGVAASPAGTSESPAVSNGVKAAAPSTARPVIAGQTERDFSYVTGDLRRIAVLAAVLVGIEVALYYLMQYTSLSHMINNLIKL